MLAMHSSPLLDQAQTLLLMGDLFNFFFTGAKACEFSNVTTTQFYNPSAGDWPERYWIDLIYPITFYPKSSSQQRISDT